MITIDGSQGEGGGQIVRSALCLSLLTGKSFRMENIRAGRPKPGLMRQHLTAVEAARAIGGGAVTGAELGSTQLSFQPGTVQPGEYHFAVGTAGSTTLVLQAILVPLLRATAPSQIVLEGGTHNPLAPAFPFFDRSFLPLLRRVGFDVTARLERPGFYPAGGGRLEITVRPVDRATGFRPLLLGERGPILARRAVACHARLSESIATRELGVIGKHLNFAAEELFSESITDSAGPGNALFLELTGAAATEIITSFGEHGRSAEKVAWLAIEEARRYLRSNAAVGEHLADQLLIPLAYAAGGKFRTVRPTSHTRTNLEIMASFIDHPISLTEITPTDWEITIPNPLSS